MDTKNFISAIEQICEEKGIAKERVLETIEAALAAAYKKDFGKKGQIIRAKLDSETGKIEIFQVKLVVDESMIKSEEEIAQETQEAQEVQEEKREEVEEDEEGAKKYRFNPEKHLMIDEAKKLKKGLKPGDEYLIHLEFHEDFGRIAAQTAKQVIIQRIKEAERDAIYEEYKDKEQELVSGIVQRIERGVVFIDIGRATGVLFPEEQIIGEYYRLGQRLRVYIIEIKKDIKGPRIILSRVHPKVISKLFELEVPEIAAGTVEIKSVAREAGSRSKIAVATSEEGIDPIGSCVGQKGTRVQAVINELGGEKIDIIEWSKEPADFIAHALSPAKVSHVELDVKKKVAKATVAEDQLSLAIGKRGQNVRLAARLTGWKIDVISATGGKVAIGGEQEKFDEEQEEKKKENKKVKKVKKEKKKIIKEKKKIIKKS